MSRSRSAAVRSSAVSHVGLVVQRLRKRTGKNAQLRAQHRPRGHLRHRDEELRETLVVSEAPHQHLGIAAQAKAASPSSRIRSRRRANAVLANAAAAEPNGPAALRPATTMVSNVRLTPRRAASSGRSWSPFSPDRPASLDLSISCRFPSLLAGGRAPTIGDLSTPGAAPLTGVTGRS